MTKDFTKHRAGTLKIIIQAIIAVYKTHTNKLRQNDSTLLQLQSGQPAPDKSLHYNDW